MYVCEDLDEVSNTCVSWVVSQDSMFGLSQADAHIIGEWLVSFFVMCCVYVIITKALKLA
jgi:hypothetical protein